MVRAYARLLSAPDDAHKRRSVRYNIALMIMLFLTVFVLSSWFAVLGEDGITLAEAAYYTIVSTGMLLGAGYFGHYALGGKLARRAPAAAPAQHARPGCGAHLGRGRQDRNTRDARLRLARQYRRRASLIAAALVVLVPWVFPEYVQGLDHILEDARGFFAMITAAAGAIALISLSLQVTLDGGAPSSGASATAGANAAREAAPSTAPSTAPSLLATPESPRQERSLGAIVGFIIALRLAIVRKLRTYSQIETYSRAHFHRTFSEAMVACIVAAFFWANVSSGMKIYLAGYALVIFIALITTMLVDFYFHSDVDHDKEPGHGTQNG